MTVRRDSVSISPPGQFKGQSARRKVQGSSADGSMLNVACAQAK
jgi:hypothetical protein